jgi:hypothetical protein
VFQKQLKLHRMVGLLVEVYDDNSNVYS